MTEQKADSNTGLSIMDFSWSKGYSVNDGVKSDLYLGTAFELYYPSADDIVHKLNSLDLAAKCLKIF